MMSIKHSTMLTVLVLVLFTAGCSIRKNVPLSTPDTSQAVTIQKNLSYYYGFADEVPLTQDTAKKLQDFGVPLSFWTSEPKTELFTEIPKVENKAKGIDPITIVLPNLDLTKYDGPYFRNDYETGLEVSVYYRVVADMITDEYVNIYVNAEGNIVQYETINLGKYDALNLNEKVIADRQLRFRDAIHKSLSSVTLDFFVRDVIHAPSAYGLFSNNEDRLVITTTTALITECTLNQSTAWLDLYAVIN